MRNIIVKASIINVILFFALSLVAQCPVIDFKSEHHEGTYPKFDVTSQKTIHQTNFQDESKILMTKRIDKAHNSSWIPCDSVQYIYDSKDRLLMYVKLKFEENAWEKNWKIEFEYDSNNNLLKDNIQNFKNGSWVNNNRDLFTYDIDGNKIIWLTQVYRGNDWINSKRILKEFDMSNNMVTYHEQTWKSGKWNSDRRDLLEYDGDNNKISSIGQNWTRFGWMNFDKILFAYNEEQHVSTNVRQVWKYNKWNNDQLEGTKFNLRGQKEMEFVKVWDTNVWFETEQVVYEYDDSQDKITRQSQKRVDGEWMIISKVEHKMDATLNEKIEAIQSFVNNELMDVQHKRTKFYYENNANLGEVTAISSEVEVCPRHK